jgi:hypothetical protein
MGLLHERSRVIHRGAVVLAATVLAACTAVTVETPDPGAIPSGEPVAKGGSAPTGPIAVLDSDQVAGIGWRFLIYESAEGQCLQFETNDLAQTGCGDLLPGEDSAFGSVSSGDSDAGLRPIHGLVSADIATVFLVDSETQERVPAKLLPLDEAGLEGQAFIGFQPDGLTITHLLALRRSGEIVETYELP